MQNGRAPLISRTGGPDGASPPRTSGTMNGNPNRSAGPARSARRAELDAGPRTGPERRGQAVDDGQGRAKRLRRADCYSPRNVPCGRTEPGARRRLDGGQGACTPPN